MINKATSDQHRQQIASSMATEPERNQVHQGGEKEKKSRFDLVTIRYTAFGTLMGSILMILAWVVEMKLKNFEFALSSIPLVHQHNPLLVLIDLGPLIGAILFAMIGRTQSKLRTVNAELEDRVSQRTFQITLEKARTNAILDTAADGIITIDQEGNIYGYNKAAKRIFGYSESEVLGRRIQILLPTFDWHTEAERANRSPSDSQDGFRIGDHEFEGLRIDGTSIPVEVDISSFSLGEDTSFTAIIRDISDRKRQQKLENSLQRVTTAVNQVQELRELYQSIHGSISEVMDVSNFYISLLNDETNNLEIVYSQDEMSSGSEGSIKSIIELMNLVRRKSEPTILLPDEIHTLVDHKLLSGTYTPVQNVLGVPLESSGKLVGVMATVNYVEDIHYTEKDSWILNFVSGQIANAIDRESARESLRQSERRYRRMIEEAGDIVYTLDARGTCTFVNPPARKLTGYNQQELIGRRFLELVRHDYRESIEDVYKEQLRTRTREVEVEFPIVTRDGFTRWVEQKTTLVKDEEQSYIFESVLHDITERRMAEEGLKEREERFRSLSTSSPIGIFQLDNNGQCIYVNKRFEELTGRPLAKCVGFGWMEAIHSDDRNMFMKEWIFARTEESSATREVRLSSDKDGERWVNIRWTALHDSEDNVSGYVGTFEDISSRKKSEKITKVLLQISEAAQTSADLQQFFRTLHQSLESIIDTTNFYIATYDEKKELISFPYAYESTLEMIDLKPRKIGKGLTGYMFRKSEPLLLDEQGIQRIYETGKAELLGKPAKSWLGIPLISESQVIGGLIIQSYTESGKFHESDVQTLSVITSQIAAALERKKAEQESRKYLQQLSDAHARIKEDLALAARIQRARLPKSPPDVEGIEFSWIFDSCDEVAGDMFNFLMLDDNHLAMYILDVSGHGVPAALLSMTLSRALTSATDGSGVLMRKSKEGFRPASPSEVAASMNERFPMNLDTNQYFTMLYGVLNITSRELTYCRCGHPPPILVSGEQVRELDSFCDPAVGILPDVDFHEETIHLTEKDRFVMFTDGLDEATSEAGEEFGFERIKEQLAKSRDASLSDAIQSLQVGAKEFSQKDVQGDDITIVAIEIR